MKADLRAAMNGVASAAMRQAAEAKAKETGQNPAATADYRVNFGVELPRLQALADELREENKHQLPALAQALWKEQVRECRILGMLIYPPENMDAELADLWVDDIRTVEIAQLAAMHVLSRFPGAADAAFRWVASEQEMKQILGFYTLIHIVRRTPLKPRSTAELRDQAQAALSSENLQLQLAAQRMLAALPEDN